MRKTTPDTTIVTSRGTTMKRRLLTSLLAAAGAVAPMALGLALSPATAHAQTVVRPTNDITLSIGRGQLVSLGARMSDIFVADEKVADVQVKSDRQIYVMGKGPGVTTIYASNASGAVVWSANVKVGSNIDSVDQMLTLAMPDAQVNVATIGNNTMLLTGTVASPEDAAEAQRLVAAYVGGAGGADSVNVISRLKMATPLQVNLQVRIAEVNRSLVKILNSNLSTIDGTGGFKFGLAQGRQAGSFFNTDPQAPFAIGQSVTGSKINPIYVNPITGQPLPSIINPATGGYVADAFVSVTGTNVTQAAGLSTLSGMTRFLGLNILGTLDAAERVGMASTLAQPNLTALSGETADFLAGGEFPIPISQGLGSVAIEYKRYGISLAYTPTVLANGRISLRVRPEVSELSTQGAVSQGGFVVPALTTRRAETTIELGSGQSFMIAGLLRNNTQNTLQKLPGAGDVPILGALFRSTNFQRDETELVIIVTPYLVNPVNAADIKLPTDGYQSPNDLQRLFGNMQHDGRSGAETYKPTTAPAAPVGPEVGALDPAQLIDQARREEARSGKASPAREGRKERRAKRTASAPSAPAPGFNLN